MTRRELVAKAATLLNKQMEHPDPHISRAAAEAILCHHKVLELLDGQTEGPAPVNPQRPAMDLDRKVPTKHSGFAIG